MKKSLSKSMPDINESRVVAELAEFSSRKRFCGLKFLWSALKNQNFLASTWWTGLCKHAEMEKVASRNLELPATSAACERSFSVQGYVHSKKRNRFSHEHTEKLVFVHQNLKLIKDVAATCYLQSLVAEKLSLLPKFSHLFNLPTSSQTTESTSFQPTETYSETAPTNPSSQLEHHQLPQLA